MSVDDAYLFGEAAKLLRSGETIALCIIVNKVGSGPRGVGAKMIVYGDGKSIGSIGGGKFERILIERALEAIKNGHSKLVEFSLGSGSGIETGLICGGNLKVLIDVIKPNPRLIIVGSGSIAKPLAEVACIAGFEVIVVDDNEKTATHDRFPMASRLIVKPLVKALSELELRGSDFIAIVHGDVKIEYAVLKELLRRKPRYIGLLGSKRKVAEFRRRLKIEGFNEDDLSILHAPIGIDINAETPGEIAVSIVAELIKILRGS